MEGPGYPGYQTAAQMEGPGYPGYQTTTQMAGSGYPGHQTGPGGPLARWHIEPDRDPAGGASIGVGPHHTGYIHIPEVKRCELMRPQDIRYIYIPGGRMVNPQIYLNQVRDNATQLSQNSKRCYCVKPILM